MHPQFYRIVNTIYRLKGRLSLKHRLGHYSGPPLFFVHIPKTAGTSFRVGGIEYFGAHRVIGDYGADSPVTAPTVKNCIYRDDDFWEFYKTCLNRRIALVSGHVDMARFIPGLSVTHTITFLRDPAQRIASEYRHMVRKNQYAGTFREFYSRNVMRNRQSRILKGAPIESIGMIGLTERYEDSLTLINARYSINVPIKNANRDSQRNGALHDISKEDDEEIRELNKEDYRLYRYSAQLLDQRYDLIRRGHSFAHARVTQANPSRIEGWAWWADSNDSPVRIDVYVNGERRGSTLATKFRPQLCRLRPPRGAHVGFSIEISANAGDTIQCRIAETQQAFPLQPLKIHSSSR